jgi:hypothetical protein
MRVYCEGRGRAGNRSVSIAKEAAKLATAPVARLP